MRKNITIRSRKQTERIGAVERSKLKAKLEADTAVFEANGGEVKMDKPIDHSVINPVQKARAVAAGFK